MQLRKKPSRPKEIPLNFLLPDSIVPRTTKPITWDKLLDMYYQGYLTYLDSPMFHIQNTYKNQYDFKRFTKEEFLKVFFYEANYGVSRFYVKLEYTYDYRDTVYKQYINALIGWEQWKIDNKEAIRAEEQKRAEAARQKNKKRKLAKKHQLEQKLNTIQKQLKNLNNA